jgi:hypothetical protein
MWLEYLFATKVFSLEKRPLLTHKRATIQPLKNEIEIARDILVWLNLISAISNVNSLICYVETLA